MAPRASILVPLLCWSMVLVEGYDIISFGTVVPVLLADSASGFGPADLGWVASAVFAGALLGALGSGWLSDRYGRRPVVLAAVAVFSVCTLLTGFAAGPVPLALFRFFAGLGIGAVLPAASALTLEYANPRYRTVSYTLMLSGVPLGGVLAALLALPVLPHLGWPWVFFLGAILGGIGLPVCFRFLPESAEYLAATGRGAAAESGPPAGDGIFRRGYALASVLFAVSTFGGLFAWYGLATWLPGIMNRAGYALDSALVFLLVLNLGAVLGSLFIAAATDRWGNKPVVVLTFLGLTAVLLLLAVELPLAPLLLCIALAGAGGHGGQILVNAFVGNSYPTAVRARALGWNLGAGRLGTIVGPIIIGGVVGGGAPLTGFLVFAAVSLLAAVLLALVPRTPALRERQAARR
ncbi:MFS transporter [Sciscionella sediminilitoris]|uniref:MFS transporter n=1 Tax=Sciscionella sediminilitoris TaxID=1445613 RepID=UPI00068AEC80|nr:MFS transporter [Sciscionella sp. SE31]